MVDSNRLSFEKLNGFRIMRVKDHPIMSPGVWNDWYYDADQLKEAYDNTDWNDENNKYLFFDHEDTEAKNWIGKVENIRMEDNTLIGDLLIANDEAQKAILMGAKFGISPKILGKGEHGSVKDFMFRNFSLVVDPACKTTFLNSANITTFLNSEKKSDDGIILNPLSFFQLHTGEIMKTEENEIKLETPEIKEEISVTRQELEETVKKTVDKELAKKKPAEEEKPCKEKLEEKEVPVELAKKDEEKKYPYPEKAAVMKKKKYPYPEEAMQEEDEEELGELEEELAGISHKDVWKMIERLSKIGVLNGEYADFIKEFAKKNPDLGGNLMKAAAAAWNKQKKASENEQRLTKLIEKKLSERFDIGEPISVKSGESATTANVDVDQGMLDYLKSMYYSGGVGNIMCTLSMTPKMHPLGFKEFNLSSTTTSTSSVRGTVFTAYPYPLQPILYLKAAVDAAKERMRYMQIVSQNTLPENTKEMVVPYRKNYLTDSSWETSSAEYAAGSEISWTQINTADGVRVSPTRYNYGIALTNEAIRTSALNEVAYMRDELSYKYENSVDSAVRDALLGTVSSTTAVAGATEMTTSVDGMQTIYGGDATDASNSLDTGDVITTDLVAKMRRLLMSKAGYFWSSNTWTKAGVDKNPWEPTAQEPFVLFIAPEQEEAFLTDPQFVNASEYGGNEVVLNGEIGRYIGVKVISTTKVPSISNLDYIVAQGAQQRFDVPAHVCSMIKAVRAGTMVWSVKPEIKIFDYPVADQVRMKLTMSYAAKAIFGDAIVRCVTSDA